MRQKPKYTCKQSSGQVTHQMGSLKGSKSRLHVYFNVVVEDNVLSAHHKEGCHLLGFGSVDTALRQVEILAAFQAMGVDISKIAALQKAGQK
ncbi:hypothetical protein ACJMK2_035266 [Sinanodonta woodiana]|uniref:Uncharacterized protein n=1 Tax=Sinanodonta woodiana TaxID=1069815 RepID=A0ABD3WUB3_SINWO